MKQITNTDDTIDSRDIIERISELELELEDDSLDAENRQEVQGELDTLKKIADDCEGYGDWKYGATLIRDSYFEEYAQHLAEDTGAISRDATWPNNYIDWEAASDALKEDYMEVDFDGVSYWMRA